MQGDDWVKSQMLRETYIWAMLEFGEDSRTLLMGCTTINHGLPHFYCIFAQCKDIVWKDNDFVLQLQNIFISSYLRLKIKLQIVSPQNDLQNEDDWKRHPKLQVMRKLKYLTMAIQLHAIYTWAKKNFMGAKFCSFKHLGSINSCSIWDSNATYILHAEN